MPLKDTKVFGVGLARTGTTSLFQAFRAMDYNVCMRSTLLKLDDRIAQKARLALGLVNEHGAFVNSPWPSLFREVGEAVPDAKFILTSRDEDSWLKSMKTHMSAARPEFEWIYGHKSIVGNEDAFLEIYRKHNQAVRDHFADKSGKLLDLDISQLGWDTLCPFLGVPTPLTPFPHKNSSGSFGEVFTRYGVPATIKATRILRTVKAALPGPFFKPAHDTPDLTS